MRTKRLQMVAAVSASMLALALPIHFGHAASAPGVVAEMTTWHISWSEACAQGSCAPKDNWDCW
jgi:hypothetical protein